MSGARRAFTRIAASNFLSVACLTPFSRSFASITRFGTKVSTDIAYMEIFIRASWTGKGMRILQDAGGAGASLMKQYPPSAERIGGEMNELWAPAQLALLAKIVDLNGFSAAARSLGVPKAAVSRSVADLEKALGVRVLERTTRRVALTAAGRLVYPHARRVAEESDAARAAIGRLHSPEGRPLR